MAQKRLIGNAESCWLRYQLALKGITQEDVAAKSSRAFSMVSMVISGERRSKNVETALAEMLGYGSWDELRTAASANAEKEAV